jgi:hypothetical protein
MQKRKMTEWQRAAYRRQKELEYRLRYERKKRLYRAWAVYTLLPDVPATVERVAERAAA